MKRIQVFLLATWLVVLLAAGIVRSQPSSTAIDVTGSFREGTLVVKWYDDGNPIYKGYRIEYGFARGFEAKPSDFASVQVPAGTKKQVEIPVEGEYDFALVRVHLLGADGKELARSNEEMIRLSSPSLSSSTLGQLNLTLNSFSSSNFPFLYSQVTVDTSGVAVVNLPESAFRAFENGVLQTDFFQVTPPATGGGVRIADIIFVMDNSGSMDDIQAAVVNNVRQFVDSLVSRGIDMRLGLVRFGQYDNGQYGYSGSPIVEDNGVTTSDVNYFKNTVLARNVSDGSFEPGFHALVAAAQRFSFRPGAQKIFILTTDEDNDIGPSPYNYTLSQTVSVLTAAPAIVYGLVDQFWGTSYTDYVGPGSVTQATGGRAFQIRQDQVTTMLNYINFQAAAQYTVRYRSSDPVFNGTTRLVKIIVNAFGQADTVETSYVPGAAPIIQRTPATIALHNQPWAEGTSFTIEADITDNVPPLVQSARLYYRRTGVATYSSVAMTRQTGNRYRGIIPGSAVQTPGLDYYITATDGQTTSSDPRTDPANSPYQFGILPNVAPVITHTPVTTAPPSQAIVVTASVVDNTNSLATVRLAYRQTGQLLFQEANMNNTTGNVYQGTIAAPYVTLAGVEYYIAATDNFGVTSYSGTRDLPHHIQVTEPWPTIQGASIVLKVVGAATGGITKVGFSGNLNWTPFKVGLNKSEELSDRRYFLRDLSPNGFAFLAPNDLDSLNNWGLPNREIWRIELLKADGTLVGHMKFHYTYLDRQNGKKVDAVLYVHNDIRVNRYDGWNYYKDENERPVSMLIPPKENVDSINTSKKPLLLVHGITGSYPYWGSIPSNQQLSDRFDVWQFYYPYDGPIEDNGKFLSQAISELLTPSRLVGGNSNYSVGRVNVVAHSMGGLVTRSYIQSFYYRSNINKLLMLGTPNHGSFAAFRIHYRHAADEIGVPAGYVFDDEAPAYEEMTPGSNFLFKLNEEPPKNLYDDSDNRKSYLVVAGTKDLLPLFHAEITNQDDGVVAVSSASLLNFDIPLGTIHSTHSELRENSTSVILEFMKDDYDPNTPAMNVFDGFWKTASDFYPPPNRNIELHKGIMELSMPGVTNQANFRITPSGNELALCQNKGGNQELWRISGRGLPSPPNYFSVDTRGINEIGLGFPEKSDRNLYDLRFQKYSFFGGCQTFSRLANRLPFRHIQTVMHSIQFSSPELTILNSTDYIFPTPIPAKSMILATAEVNVDSTIDSLVFLLSGYEGDVQFPSHDFKLQAPSGNQIDSVFAKNDPNMDFKQDIIGGYAYYFVRHPQPGSWKTLYNSNLSKGSLITYINSPFSFDILLPDSAISINNKVNFDVRLPQPRGYAISTISASLLFSGTDGATPRQISTIPLIISPDSSKYSGVFNTRDPGTYYVALDAKVTAQGKTIERHTFRSITIEYGPTPPTGGQLSNERVYFYPNPFNPELETGTIRYSLSRSGNVIIRVFDVSNRTVITIDAGEQSASAEQSIAWNGRNDRGDIVANGVYFYIIESSSGERAVGKIAVLR